MGEITAGMRACLWSRLASRVLLEIGRGPASDADSLYETASSIAWEDQIDPHRTFAVRATVKGSAMTHTKFVALKVKDGIVDRLRAQKGRRPNVDTRRPDLSVSVHLEGDLALFYLDMADEPLHRRGWRSKGGQAPLKETLAAAMLRIGGYDPGLPLCDPMCGSGTLVIEAAQMARRMAPGLNRGFGFERWPGFDEGQRSKWRELREQARDKALPAAPAIIIASDRSAEAIEAAEKNAWHAGVAKDISFDVVDARSLDGLPKGCQLFSNPPYGERLGRRRLQLEGLYRQLGEHWLSHPSLSRIVILSPNKRLTDCLGGKAREHAALTNGPIRCHLLEFGNETP